MTLKELKDELRDKDLKISGKKSELIKRLQNPTENDRSGRRTSKKKSQKKSTKKSQKKSQKKFEEMTIVELKAELRKKNLKVSGTKADLIDRLSGKNLYYKLSSEERIELSKKLIELSNKITNNPKVINISDGTLFEYIMNEYGFYNGIANIDGEFDYDLFDKTENKAQQKVTRIVKFLVSPKASGMDYSDFVYKKYPVFSRFSELSPGDLVYLQKSDNLVLFTLDEDYKIININSLLKD